MKELLTLDEVAQILRLSTRQVAALADSGALPCINVGLGETNLCRRFAQDDLEGFIESRRIQPIRPVPIPRQRAKPHAPSLERIDFLALRDQRRAERKAARQGSASKASAESVERKKRKSTR